MAEILEWVLVISWIDHCGRISQASRLPLDRLEEQFLAERRRAACY